MENKTFRILLIEDNPADVALTEEAMTKSKITVNINAVYDGNEAMDYLYKKGEFKDAPTPDLILLDLNIPGKNGHEVLNEIKQDKELKTIPVAILTSSTAEEDLVKSYKLHANCYITKPVDMSQFIKIVKTVEEFWFSIVSLPPSKN